MMTLQNMTTPLRALLPAALMLLAATACEDTLDNPAAHTGNGPALTLVLDNNEDNAGTRTDLTGSDATHHVKTVDILIFEGEGDEATYVATETVKWPQPKETVDAQPVNRMTHTLKQTFTDGKDYILLGVGKDDPSNNTYIYEGQTLGQTYAKLIEGKTKDDIAACEFFTGTVSFTYQKEVQIDNLLMKRRVAGVMLYVTEIPTKINDQKTARIELCLGENQKSSVLLKRDLENKDWREPAGQSVLNDSQVLASIELPKAGETDEIYQKEDGTPAIFNGGLYILPLNRATEGEDAATPTFLIKIYGEDNNTTLKTFVVLNQSEEEKNRETFDIRSNYLYSIGTEDKPVSLGDDVILLEVLPFTGMEVGHDFGPARIQAVFAPDFDEEKYRFNCINDVFQVEVKPSLFGDKWKINIPYTTTAYDKDFQSKTYNTTPGESLEEMTHWLYIQKEDGTVTTTYECTDDEAVNGATITFVILDYAVYRPWGWVNHTWSPQGDDIDRINNDVRWIDVTLTTTPKGADGSGTDRVDQMRITQYNTITVDFRHIEDGDPVDEDEIAICGFSRLDWGDMFVPHPEEEFVVMNDPDVPDTEIVDRSGQQKEGGYKSSGWGFWRIPSVSLYGTSRDGGFYGSRYNGAENLEEIGSNIAANYYWDGWENSASHKCETYFQRYDNGNLKTPTLEKGKTTKMSWYLPAEFEMEGLYKASLSSPTLKVNSTTKLNSPQVEHLKGSLAGVAWWTSTLYDFTGGEYVARYLSITYNPDDIRIAHKNRYSGASDEEDGDGTFMYMRPARKFTQYYKDGVWATLPDGQATE